jgi:hypothetical protein
MNEKYLKKVPQWYKSNEKLDVVLSDDIDGIVSTGAIKYAKNWDIEYFYDFSNLFITEQIYSKENKAVTRVWADVSIIVQEEKSFDNHINRVNKNDYANPNMINPNILDDITNENYYDKYLGSSALLIWSLYGIPLPKTEEGKMILLAIDTTFKGFYGKDQYRQANKHFLCDMLGFEELYEVLKRHTSGEFYQLIGKYNLSGKTWLNGNRYLQTNLDLEFLSGMLGIPLELPVKKMKTWRHVENKFSCFYLLEAIKDIDPNLITIAFTGKNKACYSIW